jgi:5-methylcytosine-specific restriction protein A
VRDYVLARAGNLCEACETQVAFHSTRTGMPYLEPHHINRLSDGGLDHPQFMAALCPTCHRQVHYGVGGVQLNDTLRLKVAQLESQL